MPDRWSSELLDIRKRMSLAGLPNHMGSEESLNTARRWLQHCMVHHGVCRSDQDETFRPTRLLYLGDNSICLHTHLEMPQRVQCLTLSHCWGKFHIVRLLERNEYDFRCAILPSELSHTFSDAVRITRHLGFSYLWIDSLCIIQDSPQDWEHEAKLMGKVYRNAVCNIAASDAPDGRHGCLYPRNPRTLQPETIPNRRPGVAAAEEEYIINQTDIYQTPNPNSVSLDSDPTHILYTRAWVLQEALLARRTLDCWRGQLFWRCGELRASEVFPGGVPTNIFHDGHPASLFKAISAERDQVILNANILTRILRTPASRDQISVAPGKGSIERYTDSPFAFWAALVKQYTSMGLTKDTDRGVAVAGITDVFRPYFGEHWFGMWKVFMPPELLWAVGGRVKRPTTVRAPSWSWMSVEGPVSYWGCVFRYRKDRLLTRLLGVEDAGEIGMRLRLLTPLLRATLDGTTRDGEPGERSFIRSIEGHTRRLSYRGIPTLPDYYGEVFWDYRDEAPPEDVFCVCIQVKTMDDRLGVKGLEVKGLEVREVEDGIFERLGHFTDYRGLMLPFVEETSDRHILLA